MPPRKYLQSCPYRDFPSEVTPPPVPGCFPRDRSDRALLASFCHFFFSSSGLRRDSETALTSAVRASHASFLSLFDRVDLNLPCIMCFRRPYASMRASISVLVKLSFRERTAFLVSSMMDCIASWDDLPWIRANLLID